ncbi:MAG: hypothetical protein JJ992_04935, partial [Planctomycetes bacterium]|nr:hypothetical protein [Planctomycetota bacterium]
LRLYELAKPISMAYGNSSFSMDINLEKRVSTELEFQFDLQDLISASDDPVVADLFGDGGLFSVGAEGAGSLAVEAFAALDFGFGFDLSNILSPSLFVTDDTGITLGADIVAGTVAREFDADPQIIDVDSDTIYLPGNKYRYGDTVRYEPLAGGASAIGFTDGAISDVLQSGDELYILPLASDPDRVRLYRSWEDLEALNALDLSDIGAGTHRLSLGRPLDFKASIGVADLGDVTLAVKNAGANLSLRARAGLAPEPDGKYTFGIVDGEAVADDLDFDFSLRGKGVLDLPLYFPTEDFPLGASDRDFDGNGIPDNVLHVDTGFALSADNKFEFDGLRVVAPSLKNAFGLFFILNDPQNILDGLEGMFDGLQAGLTGIFDNVGMPLIGDALKNSEEIDRFLDDLREKILGREITPADPNAGTPAVYEGGIGEVLAPGIAAGKSTIQILQEELLKAIGDILVTQRFDRELGRYVSVPLITTSELEQLRNDLESPDTQVRTAAESLLAQRSKLVRLTLGPDYIQFNLMIGDNLFRKEVPLDFDVAVPALGLKIDSDVSVLLSMDYLLGIGFGFSVQDTFYVDTSGVTPTGEEFSLDLSATLKGQTDPDKQQVLPAEFNATLGFVGLDLKDMLPGTDPLDDGVPTG